MALKCLDGQQAADDGQFGAGDDQRDAAVRIQNQQAEVAIGKLLRPEPELCSGVVGDEDAVGGAGEAA